MQSAIYKAVLSIASAIIRFSVGNHPMLSVSDAASALSVAIPAVLHVIDGNGNGYETDVRRCSVEGKWNESSVRRRTGRYSVEGNTKISGDP